MLAFGFLGRIELFWGTFRSSCHGNSHSCHGGFLWGGGKKRQAINVDRDYGILCTVDKDGMGDEENDGGGMRIREILGITGFEGMYVFSILESMESGEGLIRPSGEEIAGGDKLIVFCAWLKRIAWSNEKGVVGWDAFLLVGYVIY